MDYRQILGVHFKLTYSTFYVKLGSSSKPVSSIAFSISAKSELPKPFLPFALWFISFNDLWLLFEELGAGEQHIDDTHILHEAAREAFQCGGIRRVIGERTVAFNDGHPRKTHRAHFL